MTDGHEYINPDEYGPSYGHAGPDGHVCGPGEALRTFALAVLDNSDAEEVLVTPTHTLFRYPDKVLRFGNGAEMREAIDAAPLGKPIPLGVPFTLGPPTD